LFVNRIREFGLYFAGLINAAVIFLAQLLFPTKLAMLGNVGTLIIDGASAMIGLINIAKLLAKTKGSRWKVANH
tara:strand:- start:3879 stop:4100 length:222 start_codon:yes stop_codon:yes gene_type:complete